MSDPFHDPLHQPVARERPRGAGASLLPWLLGAAVVLLLAVIGGLATAYIVATMRAVPPPEGAVASATPRATSVPGASATPQPTSPTTEPPRRTPTPSPVVTPQPSPRVHVVSRGETLTRIADRYGVEVDAILELNDLANPNRIFPGQELLIPVEPSD